MKKKIIAVLLISISNLIYAQKTGETYYIQSAISGKYLDVQWAKTANNTPLHLWPFNGKVAQKFTLEDAGAGYFYIKSALGKYVHVYGASKKPKARVSIWIKVDQDNLKWKFVSAGNGYYYIQSKLGTFLDVQWGKSKDGTPIWMWNGNKGIAQKWRLKSVNNAAKNNIKIFKPTNFGEGCINIIDGHSRDNNRNIGTEVDARLNMKFELINNSIRATANLRMGRDKDIISATWSKIILKGGSNEIEGFDACYIPSREPIFKKEIVLSNTFRLPKGGAEFIGCNDGTIKDVKTSYGLAKIIGDTGGEDISDDYNCKCDSKLVDIIFREIAVKYKSNSYVKCGNTKVERINPTFEFTISNTNGFEYTFTDKDASNPNDFEVMLKPNVKYRYKLIVKDAGSGLDMIRFKTFQNGVNSISKASNDWKIKKTSSEIGYEWFGNISNLKCKVELKGLLAFKSNPIDRNEILILSAVDIFGNSFNKQINVTVKNNLSKEKVNYFFNYKLLP